MSEHLKFVWLDMIKNNMYFEECIYEEFQWLHVNHVLKLLFCITLDKVKFLNEFDISEWSATNANYPKRCQIFALLIITLIMVTAFIYFKQIYSQMIVVSSVNLTSNCEYVHHNCLFSLYHNVKKFIIYEMAPFCNKFGAIITKYPN